MTQSGKTVATPCSAYDDMESSRRLPRALMGGTAAMRAERTMYLPKEMAESDDAYEGRLKRTFLFNAFRKTIKDMGGKVFAKPVALGDDVPEKIKEYAENIDLAGRNLTNFAHDVFRDALEAGISFILGEMPPKLPDGATRADEIAQGRRPYLCHVKAHDLIGWKSAFVNGREVLTQVRIRECIAVPSDDSPFEDVTVDQIRVMEPGSVRIFQEDAKKEGVWVEVAEFTSSLDYIPLRPVYFNRTGFMTAEPPLADLADLNVAHWQSSSDQKNILHVARVPILFGAGVGEEGGTLKISPNGLIVAPHPDARLSFVEHHGHATKSGRDDIMDIEVQMQAMGLQLLVSTPGQTATGEKRDDIKENSPLAMMATELQDGLEEALGYLAEFDNLGKDSGGSVVVNRDFGITTRDETDLNLLLAAYSSKAITRLTFLRELQRRGILTEDLDIEEEDESLTAADAAAKEDPPVLDGSARSGNEGIKAGEAEAGDAP